LNDDYKIPRIIHQIWLGGPVPEKYKIWLESWQNIKGWEYRLWTDKEVEQLSLFNSDLYQSAPNYGEKADVLRYELLYLFGGLYVDTDMYCTNPDFFEFAHQQYSFYAGIEPIEACDFSIGNSIMGSAPGHPLMEKIVTDLKDFVANCNHTGTVEKTGPRYITSQLYKHISLLGNDGLVFPPTFFYPITVVERSELPHILKPENAGIHFYESSWRK
jgi:mannosyltransferase OCH1-like enzyme